MKFKNEIKKQQIKKYGQYGLVQSNAAALNIIQKL